MKKITILLFVSLLGIYAFSQNVEIAKKAVEYLASDAREGRFPGTKGDMESMMYMQEFMKKHNLQEFDFGYKQLYEIVTKIEPASDCKFSLLGKDLKMGEGFMPFSFSESMELNASVTYTNNILDSTLSVDGGWLLFYFEDPQGERTKFRELINFAIEANNKGAEGLIIVSEIDLGNGKEFYPFNYSRSFGKAPIPVVQISKDALLEVLHTEDLDAIRFLETSSNPLSVESMIKIDKTRSQTSNVCGYIECENSDEWIVLGAHYDHLGWGGYDSGSRDPELKEIHNGADDNASGVGMVLMLAEYFSNNPPEINIAFVLFGAEEQGLIGSQYFVENSPIDINKMKLMINFDMVGRLRENNLSIIGTTTAMEFDSLLNKYNDRPLKLKLGGGGYSGSDQASFYSEKIPVLFFSTGMHTDYHMPNDDVEYINFDGIKLVANLAIDVIKEFSNESVNITYQEVKRNQAGRHSGGMKVKLGVFPDMTSDSGEGLGVSGVNPGGIADKSGIRKGDVIIKMDGKTIGGIYEYMNIMSSFKPGQKIKAVVLRGKKKKKINIQF